jgi:predicted ester cyclase
MKRIILLLLAVPLFIVACNNDKKAESAGSKQAMSGSENKAEKNRQTALASVMAINNHDADAILKDAAPDCTDRGDGSMPARKGVDSIKADLKVFFAAYPDVKGENLEALSNADGSKVVVIGTWSGTFKNDFMGMKATGKSYNGIHDADIFTFNDEGKVTSHAFTQSGMTYMNAVGVKMPN